MPTVLSDVAVFVLAVFSSRVGCLVTLVKTERISRCVPGPSAPDAKTNTGAQCLYKLL